MVFPQNILTSSVQFLTLGFLAIGSASFVSAAYEMDYLFGIDGSGVFEPDGIRMRDYTYATSVTLGHYGIHSPGTQGTVGKQIFGPGLSPDSISYLSNSLFSWDFQLASDYKQSYDQVIYENSVSGPGAGAIFLVGFDSDIDYSIPFWDLSRSWDNIFMKEDGSRPDLSKIFGEVLSRAPVERGVFSIKEDSLKWSPVPEPSSALAGILLVGGALRRRRNP